MSEKGFTRAAETWNQRFSKPGYLFGTAPNKYLEGQRALFQAGQRALAVADGEGRNSVWLAQLGVAVEAFDISPVAVAKAQQLAHWSSVVVDYRVSDCDGWQWRQQAYDAVVAIFIQFAEPEMRARLFANMRAALKPGGHLVLQGYTPKQLDYNTGGPGIVEHLYTEDLLRQAFAGLEMVELRAYEDDLAEGQQHFGRSALIGMVARKPL